MWKRSCWICFTRRRGESVATSSTPSPHRSARRPLLSRRGIDDVPVMNRVEHQDLRQVRGGASGSDESTTTSTIEPVLQRADVRLAVVEPGGLARVGAHGVKFLGACGDKRLPQRLQGRQPAVRKSCYPSLSLQETLLAQPRFRSRCHFLPRSRTDSRPGSAMWLRHGVKSTLSERSWRVRCDANTYPSGGAGPFLREKFSIAAPLLPGRNLSRARVAGGLPHHDHRF